MDVFLEVWREQYATYTLEKGRLKRADLPVTHLVREELIAERASLPGPIMTHNWSDGGGITLKRERGRMAFFVNDEFVNEFAITTLPFNEIGLSAAFPSTIEITSMEATQLSGADHVPFSPPQL